MAMSYECWAYKDGKPYKMVKVSASTQEEAIALAWEKFQSLGVSPEKVTAK